MHQLVVDIEAVDEPTAFVLTTPSAEGKTTALMQIATRLQGRGTRVLWHKGDRLDLNEVSDRLHEIRGTPVCLVVDDAASFPIATAIASLEGVDGHPISLLVAARDIDWQLARLPKVQTLGGADVAVHHVTGLSVFDDDDAEAVLAFWEALNEIPADLQALRPDERASELATRTQRKGGESDIRTSGSLLAALLKARQGLDTVRSRVAQDLRGLVERDAELGVLVAILAVADMFEIDGLDRLLLEQTYLRLSKGGAVGPLLEALATEVTETSVGKRGKVYGTRHELVAKVVVENVGGTVGFEVETLCQAMIDAAEALGADGPPYPPMVDVARMQSVLHVAPRVARIAWDTNVAPALLGCQLAEHQEALHATDLGFASDTVLSKVFAREHRDAAQRARTILRHVTDYPRWSKGIRSLVQHLSLAESFGSHTDRALFLSLVALSDQISPDFAARDVPKNLAGLAHRCKGATVANRLRAELEMLLEASTRAGTKEWSRAQALAFAKPYARTHLLLEALREVANELEPVLPALDERLPPIALPITFTDLIQLVRRAVETTGPTGAHGRLGTPEAEEYGEQHFRATLEGWWGPQQETGEPLKLYPAQKQAMRALKDGSNVIMATPTGSGKTLVATWAAYLGTGGGRRVVYTAPTRALVHEKFLEWREFFGAKRVSLATGDETVNPGGRVLCCTTEILAEGVIRNPERLQDPFVILDEAHFYADAERGLAWQIPLIHLHSAQFLLMSATLTGSAWLERELSRATGRRTLLVSGDDRPVDLEYEWSSTPLAETTRIATEKSPPVYVVTFRRQDARTLAKNREEGRRLSGITYTPSLLVASLEPKTPFGRLLKESLEMRIAIHHGGMLPYYRRVVERLVSEGAVDLVFGTDTLGVGVNMPIQTVVFSRLWKNHGGPTGDEPLTPTEFHQIAGRAGRAGRSPKGFVVGVAPASGAVGRRGRVRTAPRPLGGPKPAPAQWDETTFNTLRSAPVEPLVPAFGYTLDFFLGVLSARRGRVLEAVSICKTHHLSGAAAVDIANRVHDDARKVIRAMRALPPDRVVDYGVLRHRSAFGISAKNRALLFLAVALNDLFATSRPSPDDLLVLCEAAESAAGVRKRLERFQDKARSKGDEEAFRKAAPFLEEPALAAEAREAARQSRLQELGLLDADDYVGLSVSRTLLDGTRSLADLLDCDFLDHEDDLRAYFRQIDRWIGKWLPWPLMFDELLDHRVRLRDVAAQLESSVLDEVFDLEDPLDQA